MSISEVVRNNGVEFRTGTDRCWKGTAYWRYIKSEGGDCGGGTHGSTNRRLGCDGDYVKGSCRANLASRDDHLECWSLNPQSCPDIAGSGKSASWTKSDTPDCGTGVGECPNPCRAHIEANNGNVTCKYDALNTIQKLRGHESAFASDPSDNRANALETMCKEVHPNSPTSVLGDDFVCRRNPQTGQPATRCTPYMAIGELATMCQAHLQAKSAEDRDALMQQVCGQENNGACQEGQDDENCLVECGCAARASNRVYQSIAMESKSMNDGCWYPPCKMNEFHSWQPSDVGAATLHCPDICQNIVKIKNPSAEVINIGQANDCGLQPSADSPSSSPSSSSSIVDKLNEYWPVIVACIVVILLVIVWVL